MADAGQQAAQAAARLDVKAWIKGVKAGGAARAAAVQAAAEAVATSAVHAAEARRCGLVARWTQLLSATGAQGSEQHERCLIARAGLPTPRRSRSAAAASMS